MIATETFKEPEAAGEALVISPATIAVRRRTGRRKIYVFLPLSTRSTQRRKRERSPQETKRDALTRKEKLVVHKFRLINLPVLERKCDTPVAVVKGKGRGISTFLQKKA